MGRVIFLACMYRDASGDIREIPLPKGEPDRDSLPADLYCPWYEVKKGLFGPTRLLDLGISIFNTRSYRPDERLVELVRERLVRAILAREGPEVVEGEGGLAALRERIEAEPFWA